MRVCMGKIEFYIRSDDVKVLKSQLRKNKDNDSR